MIDRCLLQLRNRLWTAGCLILSCSSGGVPNAAPTISDADTAEIRVCSAPDTTVVSSVADYVAAMDHGSAYEPLTIEQMNSVIASARALDRGDIASAMIEAPKAGYRVRSLLAGDSCNWLLEPTSVAPVGQATLMYASKWDRNLLIEAPHAYDDQNTDIEGAWLFTSVRAKAFVISGARRCASRTSSGCHSNGECDATNRIPAQSDPSHSFNNSLNAVHLAFRTMGTTVLQLHTNRHPEVNGDALVSNGTLYPIAGTVADAFHQALADSAIDIRWCNDPAGRLPGGFCGDTNTQSLASNGAADTCTGRSSSDGTPDDHRMIHLEQATQRMCANDVAGLAPNCLESADSWTDRIGRALEIAIAREP